MTKQEMIADHKIANRGRPPVAPADKRHNCVKVYLTDAELMGLDELRGDTDRSAYLRELLTHARLDSDQPAA